MDDDTSTATLGTKRRAGDGGEGRGDGGVDDADDIDAVGDVVVVEA